MDFSKLTPTDWLYRLSSDYTKLKNIDAENQRKWNVTNNKKRNLFFTLFSDVPKRKNAKMMSEHEYWKGNREDNNKRKKKMQATTIRTNKHQMP